MDYENLITSSVVDSGTAEILGEYYIRGKWLDFGLTMLFLGIVFVFLILFGFFTRDRF